MAAKYSIRPGEFKITNHADTDYAYLYIQDGCDYNCTNCIVAGGLTPQKSATLEQIQKGLDFAKWWNWGKPPFNVCLSGGNPLLHNDLISVINLIKKETPNIVIMINGSQHQFDNKELWQYFIDNHIRLKIRPYVRDNSNNWVNKANSLGVEIGGFGHDYYQDVEFGEVKLKESKLNDVYLKWHACQDYMRCATINCVNNTWAPCSIPTLCHNLGLDYCIENEDYYSLDCRDRSIFNAKIPHMCKYCRTRQIIPHSFNNKRENYEG